MLKKTSLFDLSNINQETIQIIGYDNNVPLRGQKRSMLFLQQIFD